MFEHADFNAHEMHIKSDNPEETINWRVFVFKLCYYSKQRIYFIFNVVAEPKYQTSS